ncbi:hypothetical protein N5P37_002198 [Trichoderma harzianum]|uniref:Uncharacterized protein n=1 Tax=Trichoderma harzianum CBS 226.95 TaxID=983964 RepID=A0A2T4AF26_TRIHA|nr:hypothetical protein M431DRAFT_507196 [Trichoderma harzianum CBS 226.95]KAK0764731.1 hypothetical protein N5P37_002198 [Trichoderma harzianum]PKK47294.1 hypothetical protein CI102_7023 [Trichoderma harzianum]PTB55528.1 hypothetical protein M431DRAFT_507196 [Trichoderma harzianum CBS 226.95]
MSSTGGSQRASEVNSAMLNVPGYADDTMLFMMRWGSLAQATLRKVDYDEFLVRLSALNTHWFASQRSQSTSGSPVSVVGTRGSGQGDDGGPKAEAAAATVAAARAAGVTAEAATTTSCEDDRDGGGVHTGDDDDAVDPPQAGDKAAELKARTLELIQDFPQLVRDFDKFVDCTRIMATKYGRAPV